jgi:hypothetical protein
MSEGFHKTTPHGSSMEQEWSRSGAGVEQEWSRSGAGVEQEWSKQNNNPNDPMITP